MIKLYFGIAAIDCRRKMADGSKKLKFAKMMDKGKTDGTAELRTELELLRSTMTDLCRAQKDQLLAQEQSRSPLSNRIAPGSGSGKWCRSCRVDNHWGDECHYKDLSRSQPPRKEMPKCRNCHARGHMEHQCWSKRPYQQRGPQRDRSQVDRKRGYNEAMAPPSQQALPAQQGLPLPIGNTIGVQETPKGVSIPTIEYRPTPISQLMSQGAVEQYDPTNAAINGGPKQQMGAQPQGQGQSVDPVQISAPIGLNVASGQSERVEKLEVQMDYMRLQLAEIRREFQAACDFQAKTRLAQQQQSLSINLERLHTDMSRLKAIDDGTGNSSLGSPGPSAIMRMDE